MFKCKRSNAVWLPYGNLVTKILINARINMEGDYSNTLSTIEIGIKSLIEIDMWVSNRELEHKPTNI